MIDYLQLEIPSAIVEESIENEELFFVPKKESKISDG